MEVLSTPSGQAGPERYRGGGAVPRRRWVVNNNKITSEERGSSTHSTSPGWRPPAHLALGKRVQTGWHGPARRSPGGTEALRIFVEEERWSLREGRTLEVLFKNSERMFRKSESEMSADLLFVF